MTISNSIADCFNFVNDNAAFYESADETDYLCYKDLLELTPRPNNGFYITKRFRCEPNETYTFNEDIPETIAMFIIRKWKRTCPEWARCNPNISNNTYGTIYSYWIKFIHTEPPEWMRPNIETLDISTLAKIIQLIISETKLPIPNYLITATTDEKTIAIQNSLRNYIQPNSILSTLLMNWIMYRERETAPEFIIHNKLVRNMHQDTTAMIWIQRYNNMPPDYLIHNPYARNDQNMTMLDLWIEYSKECVVDNQPNIPAAFEYRFNIDFLPKHILNWYQKYDIEYPNSNTL